MSVSEPRMSWSIPQIPTGQQDRVKEGAESQSRETSGGGGEMAGHCEIRTKQENFGAACF